MDPGISYSAPKKEGERYRDRVPKGTRPAFLSPEAEGPSGGRGGGLKRNPSAIKEIMLNWCKENTEGYEHVEIKDFANSWNDGMAFAALVHHFYPEAFDYNQLDPKNRGQNFTVAFDAGKKYCDVDPVLEVKDLMRMKNMDWKVTYTYIQSLYRSLCRQKKTTPLQPPKPE